MTCQVKRPGWGPFTDGWYHSTDGRFHIFVFGWEPAGGARALRADGSTYGYSLSEGDVGHGRFATMDAAVAEAKKLRSEG